MIGGACGPDLENCCVGATCVGFEGDEGYSCYQSCDDPSDCASGNCLPLSDGSGGVCIP
jgi:hypothetical protein